MHGVAAGEHASGDQHDVADLERPHLRVGDRRLQRDLASRAREAGGDDLRRQHRLRRVGPVAVQPLGDRAGRRIEPHAETAEGPAVVRDRNEEAGRQPVERADLAADERRLAAESHRPDRQPVRLVHDRRLERRQPRIRVRVVERAEQLFLGVQVAGRAVAADADADRARAASFALRLPDRVQDALAHAFERAIRAAEMIELRRQRSTARWCSRSRRLSGSASPRCPAPPTDRSG